MLFRWGRRGRWQAAHAEACRSVGIAFVPLVAETLGGWSQEAINTIKDIGRIQGHRLGIPPSESTRHLFQRLSISLWKGNSSLWIRRQPTVSPAVDDLFSLRLLNLLLFVQPFFLLSLFICLYIIMSVLLVVYVYALSLLFLVSFFFVFIIAFFSKFLPHA